LTCLFKLLLCLDYRIFPHRPPPTSSPTHQKKTKGTYIYIYIYIHTHTNQIVLWNLNSSSLMGICIPHINCVTCVISNPFFPSFSPILHILHNVQTKGKESFFQQPSVKPAHPKTLLYKKSSHSRCCPSLLPSYSSPSQLR
jgi:hypothetical protein